MRTLPRWVWVVYRELETLDDDDNYNKTLTPLAGYETLEQAKNHAKALKKGSRANWDPFLDPLDRCEYTYIVGALPLIIPTSTSNAPLEMNEAIQVLRDRALETKDRELEWALPSLPMVFPIWSITGNSTSKITHWFDGKPKNWRNRSNTERCSPCGEYLNPRQGLILIEAPQRKCMRCLKLLQMQEKATPESAAQPQP